MPASVRSVLCSLLLVVPPVPCAWCAADEPRANRSQTATTLIAASDPDEFNNESVKSRKKKNPKPEPKSNGGSPAEKPSRPAPAKKGEPQPGRSSPADSAESVSPQAAKPDAIQRKFETIPLAPAEGPPDKVWNEYFRKNRADPHAVADLILRLHKAKKREELIACINAALIQGQSQPWMYTVLALEMEEAGRPKEEIERVLMSTIDFSAVNVANILYSGAFLARFGAKDRALAMYRQASAVDPARIEPYVLGLRLAREANDADAVAWAAAGILQRAWGADHEHLQKEAEATARDMEAALRNKRDDEAADKLAAAIAEALKRDLVVELRWNGKADLDLLVEEPSGAVCSADNPVTSGGGIFIHDGYGGDSKDCFDEYVCPMGMPGDYRLTVRHVSGEVVGKRAVLRIIRYQGSPRQIEDLHTIKLSDQDKVVRITLSQGRLKELGVLPVLDVPRETLGQGRRRRRERLVWHGQGSGKEKARFEEGRRLAGRAGPGYQPVITVIPDGVQNTAMAIISGDRRYVRLTMVPMFNTLTDVQTFSFVNTGNPNGAGGGGTGQTGGGAGQTGGGFQ